ncbi:STAS domain-containing protein [Actinomadura rubrisoli]|nr:STAS domain-containing protein [Actinomadura rubrisoli]
MTEETRAARRPGRRGPEVRCRTGTAAVRVPAAWVPGATPDLEIVVARVRGDTAVAAVTGEIDLHTSDALRARLVELHGAGFRRLVVDFTAVPFCDATGLGALVAAHNHVAARGGQIALAGVRPAQLRLLRITGLHRLFALHVDADHALAAQGSSTTSR